MTTGPVVEATQKAAQEPSRRGPGGPTAVRSARFPSAAASHNFLRSPECSSCPKSRLKEGGAWSGCHGDCEGLESTLRTHSRHVMLLEQSPGNNSRAPRGPSRHRRLLQHLSERRRRHNQAGMRRNATRLPFLLPLPHFWLDSLFEVAQVRSVV